MAFNGTDGYVESSGGVYSAFRAATVGPWDGRGGGGGMSPPRSWPGLPLPPCKGVTPCSVALTRSVRHRIPEQFRTHLKREFVHGSYLRTN